MRAQSILAVLFLAVLCALCMADTASFKKTDAIEQAIMKRESTPAKYRANPQVMKRKKSLTTAKKSNKNDSSSTLTASKIYGKHRLSAYVVDWEIPKSIQWNKLDHIVYAFAEPNEKGELKSFTDSTLKSGLYFIYYKCLFCTHT